MSWVDAGDVFQKFGGVSKGIGDVRWFGVDPFVLGFVVEFVDLSIVGCACSFEAQGDTAQGFGWAKVWVVGGLVADAFPFEGILLVRKFQVGVREPNEVAFVIQRCQESGEDATIYCEVDV